MYCHKCGALVNDGAKFCHKCGAALVVTINGDVIEPSDPYINDQASKRQSSSNEIRYVQEIHVDSRSQGKNESTDAPSVGYSILSFFIPILGLILWLSWRPTQPLRAKSCRDGMLIGILAGVLYYIL